MDGRCRKISQLFTNLDWKYILQKCHLFLFLAFAAPSWQVAAAAASGIQRKEAGDDGARYVYLNKDLVSISVLLLRPLVVVLLVDGEFSRERGLN